MNGFFRIHFARRVRAQFKLSARLQLTKTSGSILLDQLKIVNHQTPVRHRHPAFLIPMIVNNAFLTRVPANRKQLEQRRLVDQISRVMLRGKVEIRRKARRINRMTSQKCEDVLMRELLIRNRGKFFGEVVYVSHVKAQLRFENILRMSSNHRTPDPNRSFHWERDIRVPATTVL